MDQPPNPDFLDDITGALDWWRTAGVDCDFLDEPVEWLAAPEGEEPAPVERRRPPPRPDPEAPPPVARLDPGSLPQGLEAFASWWMTEPLLCEVAPPHASRRRGGRARTSWS
ncbi:hypothetical protein ACFSHP_13570 [Novosphingobium panipatense]